MRHRTSNWLACLLAITACCHRTQACLIAREDLAVVESPFPIDYPSSNPLPNRVLRVVPTASRIEVIDRVVGKDYLMYKIRDTAGLGYVQFDITKMKEAPCDG